MSVGIILTSGIPTQATEVGNSDEIIANDETGIPDAILYQKILKQCDANHDGILTKDEAAATEELDLITYDNDENEIKNLQGIQFFTNLVELDALGNQISDINVLSSLTNLKWLNLGDNQISDISALSSLTNLTGLGLHDNQISDISALSSLTNLAGLTLHDNQISDISALSGMTKMEGLDLCNNQISSISALSGMTKLDSLYLYNNQISDIRALSALTNLTALGLTGNQISDISALSGMTKMWELYLDNNQISDISALSEMTELCWLYLTNNRISDISALSNLTNLEQLYLENNQISDISALSGLTKLWRLHLDNNQITDISVLYQLPIWDDSVLESFDYYVSYDGNPIGESDVVVVEEPVLTSEAFASILEENQSKDVIIKASDDVTFTFKKGTMKAVDGIEHYDFTVTVTKDYTAAAGLPAQVTNDTFIAKIDYNYSGQLPAAASIKILVGKDYAGQKLYYSQIMDDGSVVPIQDVTVDSEGYVTVTQDHCSTYILTREAVNTGTGTGTTETAPSGTPKTGDGSMPVTYGILAVSALAALLMLRRKETI